MPVFFNNKRLFTDDGIPYMWQSGDVTTTPNASDVMSYSSGAVGDQFGYSVAVGSGRIVVGDGYNDVGSNIDQGTAHVFDLNGNVTRLWITASDGAAEDRFGTSVAVGSGRIVVGARLHDVGINTNQGLAHVFDLNGNVIRSWITASDGAANDEFGTSVAVGSGRIVVTARLDDVGINTNQGSAYIYDLDGNNEVKITASDGSAYDYFGRSVAVGHQKIVVGANQKDGAGISRGAAYIYDLDGTQVGILTGYASFDGFGRSVAVGCGKIVVGATGAETSRGAAYIYDLDGNLIKKITASDGAAYDYFGQSVAVGSGRIVVSAENAGINTTGQVYIFDLNGNELGIITASDSAGNDDFGRSVAVGNGRIVVGATGVDVYRGAAYVYDLVRNQVDIITDPNRSAYDYFGQSVAVGSGRIVVGATGDGNGGTAHLYNTPLVYNLYDAIDLNYG